jgi:hypothetical protein
MKKIPWVWVVNGSDRELADRFDGEEYVFPPGKPVEIPADGAKLIFGWGEDNKSRALQRLGWMRTNLDMEPALARLKKFSFYTEDPRSPPHAPVGGDDGASDSDASVSESEAGAAKPWLRSPFKPQREAPAP